MGIVVLRGFISAEDQSGDAVDDAGLSVIKFGICAASVFGGDVFALALLGADAGPGASGAIPAGNSLTTAAGTIASLIGFVVGGACLILVGIWDMRCLWMQGLFWDRRPASC